MIIFNDRLTAIPGKPVLLAILAYSVLRGIRFPNIWSTTHLLFNYDHGFVKRGLIGSIIKKTGSAFLYSYNFAFIFSMLILIINCWLLYLAARDFLRSSNPAVFMIPFVYLASLGVVFLSHTSGYADHLGLMATLIALRIKKFAFKALFILMAFTVLILIHEGLFVIFIPVVLFSLLMDSDDRKGGSSKALVICCSVVLLVVFIAAGSATISSNAERAMFLEVQNLANYQLRTEAFEVLSRDLPWTLNNMIGFWSIDGVFLELFNSLLVTLPAVVMFIYLSGRLLGVYNKRGFIFIAAILASVSPYLLHVVSYDMHRWNTLAVTTSFITCHVVHTRSGAICRIRHLVFRSLFT